jgi:hypothetical protein
MKVKLILVVVIVAIITTGAFFFLGKDVVKEAVADPSECTICSVTCTKDLQGNCHLSGDFCLDCGESPPSWFYRVHGSPSGWIEISVSIGGVECVSPCVRYLGDQVVTCGKYYDWKVVCGHDPESNVQCQGSLLLCPE